MQQNILYIHGFNSSPLSQKAIETKTYIESHFPEVGFYSPQVANTPAEAVKQFHNIITSQPNAQWFVMGSSLGGYFSTYLSEFYQIKAVLVNPAIKPFELLTDALGEHTNPYTEQTYEVTTAHLDELQSCFQTSINAERYYVMVQTGDEVLDYRQAVDKFANCQLVVQQGGDHSFIDYAQMLPSICDFFALR